MKLFLPTLLLTTCLFSCVSEQNQRIEDDLIDPIESAQSSAERCRSERDRGEIEVLNFATFHMGLTSDANTTDFDEHDRRNREEANAIAAKLAEFKPTVILVEMVPESDQRLDSVYRAYCQNPDMEFEQPSEIELVAFEVGRLSGAKQIHGVDHRLGYNYAIGFEIENTADKEWHDNYYGDPFSFHPNLAINEDSLDLQGKLKLNNDPEYLDFLIAVNAEMLTHAATDEGFEGADQATLYYQRNLRMYTNMNRLDLDSSDRVFIIMGGSHTAFFREFIRIDPKYRMVNTFEYLD